MTMFRSIRVYFVTNLPDERISELFRKHAQGETSTPQEASDFIELLRSVQAIEIERLTSNDEEKSDAETKERTSVDDEKKEESEAISQ